MSHRVRAWWHRLRHPPVVSFHLWDGPAGLSARTVFHSDAVQESHTGTRAIEQALGFLLTYEPRLGVDVQRVWRQSRGQRFYRYGLFG